MSIFFMSVSRSQVRALDARVARELGGGAVERDASVLEHEAMVRKAQHLARVLLGDQNRGAGRVDRGNALEDRVERLRREAQRRLVQQQQMCLLYTSPSPRDS